MIYGLIFLVAAFTWHHQATDYLTPMQRATIRQDARERLDNFNRTQGTHFLMPRIDFDDTSPEEYASTDVRTGEISINAKLCAEQYQDCLTDTVPHEEAHWIASRVYGVKINHGAPWLDAMRKLGGDPCKHGYCGG